MPAVPESELRARIAKVRGNLVRSGVECDLLLVVETADLYYLSGTVQAAHLLIPREGEPRLLVRRVFERAREDSALADVRPFRSLKDLRSEIEDLAGPPPWRIGFEEDVLPVALFERYRKLLGRNAEWCGASRGILAARALKSEWEIERLRESAAIHRRIFERLPELARGARTTFELQSRVEAEARAAGHLGLVRLRGFNMETGTALVVSGREGAVPGALQFPVGGRGPHPAAAHGGGADPIEPEAPVLVDVLANRSGYHADCTRMAAVGPLRGAALEIFERMQSLLRLAERLLVPGARPSEVYAALCAEADRLGAGGGFMGQPDTRVRFAGHGVGLQVDELPVLAPGFDEPLEEGNVLAVEPKHIAPDTGAVGLENTYVVRRGGPENLTPWPEEVIALPPP